MVGEEEGEGSAAHRGEGRTPPGEEGAAGGRGSGEGAWGVSHLDLGGQTRARLTCVLGSSLTHIMTHGTETNVTSLIYNRVLYKIVK
jgi:hypothetical protein